MYSMKDAVIRNMELMEENQHLRADVKRFADLNDALIEDNEAFQKEIERLKAELADERDRFDKLSDFEVAEAEDFQEAKLYIRILLEYLAETGYNVEKLEKIVALKRCIKKLEEEHE